MSHRIARAIAPATNTTAANPKVNASGASVSISDLYIPSPFVSDESRQARRCERDKASPRLKLARFVDLRGRTRGGSVSATIAQGLPGLKRQQLHRQHMHVADRLLVPALRDGAAHGAPHRLGHRVGIAPARFWHG